MDRYSAGQVELKPDVLAYSMVMKCCAWTSGTKAEQRKALELAMQIIESMEKEDNNNNKNDNRFVCPPNDVAYSTALLAINRLAGGVPQREELLGSVFERCARRGFVSSAVLTEMNQGGSLRLFLQLTNGKNQLDPEWSRNVPPKLRPQA